MIHTVLVGILITVLMVFLFGLTIFVHELGHFLAARSLGLVVETFSIGFGPPIWKKRVNGVLYKIGAIPLGGYVSLPQLDPTAMATVQGKPSGTDDPPPAVDASDSSVGRTALPAIAPWRKIIVSLAGSVGNIIFAILLAWLIALHPRAMTGGDETRIGGVDPESPAYAAGLRPGDNILSVNDQRVLTWSEFLVETHLSVQDDGVRLEVETPGEGMAAPLRWSVELPVVEISEDLRGIAGLDPGLHCVVLEVFSNTPAQAAGIEPEDVIEAVDGVPIAGVQQFIDLLASRGERETSLAIRRRGTLKALSVIPRPDPETGQPLIGVHLADVPSRTPMWMQYRRPWRQIESDFRQITRILRALVAPRTRSERGQAAGALGGPLAIMVMLWMSVQASMLSSLGFVRFLNVNLAVLNMLPIPVLDGGHIMFSLWEMVTRRRVSPRLINILVNLFAILLIIAVLLISRNDVRRLWRVLRSREAPVEQSQPETESQVPAVSAGTERDE